MDINIASEDIDKFVKDAFLKATIGKNMKEGIEKALNKVMSGWDSPFEKYIKDEINLIVKEYMGQEHVRQEILGALAEVISKTNVKTIVEAGLKKLEQDMKDY